MGTTMKIAGTAGNPIHATSISLKFTLREVRLPTVFQHNLRICSHAVDVCIISKWAQHCTITCRRLQ